MARGHGHGHLSLLVGGAQSVVEEIVPGLRDAIRAPGGQDHEIEGALDNLTRRLRT